MRLARAPVVLAPYRYCYVRDVFPVAFYHEMLSALPPNEAYGEEEYKSRRILDPQGLPFWSDLCGWMGAEPYLSKLVRKFGMVRQERFGDQELQIKYNIRLVRDEPTYWLKPHTDIPEKFLSFLFYLPRDDRLRGFGTTIYRHKDPDFVSTDGHWNGAVANFEPVWTAPFMPNTCFAFARTDKSFHGVMQSDCGHRRDALLLNIFVEFERDC